MNKKYFFYKGRVALYAILKALGVGEGDEVIIPGFTCIVVPNAIIYLGAKPVYADIDAGTFNISAAQIESKITEKTRAVITQHTFGIPAEMDLIISVARKHDLHVIEDDCHAIGSRYKGREVGTFGDAAFFSSQWSKPVTTGLGGWAVVNDHSLVDTMETIYEEFEKPSFYESTLMRLQYALYSSLFTPHLYWLAQGAYRRLASLGIAIGSSSVEELLCQEPPGYKKMMTKWQERLLNEKLDGIRGVIEHRKWVVSQYERLLPQIGFKPLVLPHHYDPVFLRYPVLVEDKNKCLDDARKNRLEIGDWFISPVHPNLGGFEKACYRKGMCPVSEYICEHVINLPTNPKITEQEIGKIIKFLQRYCSPVNSDSQS